MATIVKGMTMLNRLRQGIQHARDWALVSESDEDNPVMDAHVAATGHPQRVNRYYEGKMVTDRCRKCGEEV